MKNIKKVMAMIMIVAVLFGGVVFGATLDDADLTITANIKGVHQIEVFTTATAPTGVSVFGDGAEDLALGEIDQSGDNTTSESYVLAVRTNQRSATSITIAVPDLTGTNYADNFIQYSLAFASPTSITIASPGTSNATDTSSNTITVPGGGGLRVVSFPFTVNIADAAFRAANPDLYTATIAFLYTSP